MVGTKEEPGIVPLVADEIFRRIEDLNAKQVSEGATEQNKVTYEVKVAMMELYNEEIRDLLNPKGNPTGGLKIREDPTLGPFVQDLIFTKVKSYTEIEKTMDQGTAMRTVRQTQMNDKSSRAHTIVQIVISQKVYDTKKNDGSLRVSRESSINLIDLAGSERQKDSGVTGDGMKEAIAINTSLTFLGKVITSLAEIAEGKNKNQVVPYRSSKLTFLLKNSLGGNAKTIMIAAVRPGADFYEESVSTLRYADSAKKIKNKPVINEDPRDASIRLLKEEIERLKEQLGQDGSTSTGPSDSDSADVEALKKELEKSQSIISQLQEQSKDDEERDAELAKLREQLLSKSGIVEFDRTQISHILNLQEDPQQSGVIAYPIDKVGQITIGKESADSNPDIILSGFGIKKNHAIIKRSADNRLFIVSGENATVHRNGVEVQGEVEIFNNDRIIFGNTLLFRVVVPTTPGFNPDDNTYDWNFAQKEYVQVHLNTASAEKQKEIEERLRKLDEEARKQDESRKALEAAKLAVEAEISKKSQNDASIVQLRKQLEEQQQAILAKERELENLKNKKAQEEIQLVQEQQKQDSPFQARVLELIHLVQDANEIVRKIGKEISYEMRIVNQIDDTTGETVEDLVVVSTDLKTGTCSIIADEDFLVRIYKMKSIYSDFKNAKDTGRQWTGIDPEDDPFVTEGVDEPQVYGSISIPFVSLYNLTPSRFNCDIKNLNGEIGGSVTVEISATDASGKPEGVYDSLGLAKGTSYNASNLSLVGKKLFFNLRFISATGLNPNHCSGSFIRYALPFDSNLHETQPSAGQDPNPTWKYLRLVSVDVTQNIENFFKKGLLNGLVYARPSGEGVKKRGVKELKDEITMLHFELEEARSTIKQLIHDQKQTNIFKNNLERRLAIISKGNFPIVGENETEDQKRARTEYERLKREKKERKQREKAEKKARKELEKKEKKAKKDKKAKEEKEGKSSKDSDDKSKELERLNARLNQYEFIIKDLESKLPPKDNSSTTSTSTATPTTNDLIASKDKEIEALKNKLKAYETNTTTTTTTAPQAETIEKKSKVCIIS